MEEHNTSVGTPGDSNFVAVPQAGSNRPQEGSVGEDCSRESLKEFAGEGCNTYPVAPPIPHSLDSGDGVCGGVPLPKAVTSADSRTVRR